MRDEAFHSRALGREMRYRILLPAGYPSSDRRYPVLYLLHGLYGDFQDWDTRTQLRQSVRGLDLIVVMPDAGDSWYVNWPGEPSRRYEDYIVPELVQEIDARYRTDPSRSARAIAGLSMGGYGALKFALKYPKLFAFAGSLSGALDAPRDLHRKKPEFAEQLVKAFGPDGSFTRAENDLARLLGRADVARLPYIYMDCGSSDSFLAANREFVALLSQRGVAYEYHEIPGGHGWGYWNRQLPTLLRSLSAALQLSAAFTRQWSPQAERSARAIRKHQFSESMKPEQQFRSGKNPSRRTLADFVTPPRYRPFKGGEQRGRERFRVRRCGENVNPFRKPHRSRSL